MENSHDGAAKVGINEPHVCLRSGTFKIALLVNN